MPGSWMPTGKQVQTQTVPLKLQEQDAACRTQFRHFICNSYHRLITARSIYQSKGV
jgi:hypothetical protein